MLYIIFNGHLQNQLVISLIISEKRKFEEENILTAITII